MPLIKKVWSQEEKEGGEKEREAKEGGEKERG